MKSKSMAEKVLKEVTKFLPEKEYYSGEEKRDLYLNRYMYLKVSYGSRVEPCDQLGKRIIRYTDGSALLWSPDKIEVYS